MDKQITSWGTKTSEVDVRALRIWVLILKKIDKFNEALAIFLLISIGLAMIAFFYNINFENAIFNDGTERSCMLNGITGKITNAK